MNKLTPAQLVQVPISEIDPNPFRDLKRYPANEPKIETLMRSIDEEGFWEGLMGRKAGNRTQLPFGVHRFLAAKRLKLTHLPLLLREMSDEKMLRMMAHENLEDYNHDFLNQLEVWEATVKFKNACLQADSVQPIEVARFLGWTKKVSGTSDKDQANSKADACHAAHLLIQGGHLSHSDLVGLATEAARNLVERTQSRIEMLDRLGKKGGRPVSEIKADQKIVANAGRSVARDLREGNVAKKDIRTEIDYRAVKTATKKDKVSPLFAHYAKQVAESIHKMLVDDKVAERLAEVEKALPLVTLEEDERALRRMDFALAEHEDTTGKWRKRLAVKGAKVIPFALLTKEDK
jgi:hypothetical protein